MRRPAGVVGVGVGVVEHLGRRHVGVHALLPRLLAQRRRAGTRPSPRPRAGPRPRSTPTSRCSRFTTRPSTSTVCTSPRWAWKATWPYGLRIGNDTGECVVLEQHEVGLLADLDAAEVRLAAQRPGAAAGGPLDDLLGAQRVVGDRVALARAPPGARGSGRRPAWRASRRTGRRSTRRWCPSTATPGCRARAAPRWAGSPGRRSARSRWPPTPSRRWPRSGGRSRRRASRRARRRWSRRHEAGLVHRAGCRRRWSRPTPRRGW